MVKGKTADGNFEVKNGRVHAPKEPGLGIIPRLSVLGKSVASYS
jgi:cis-L-3-hydroxyproline dehydratase